MRHLNNISSPMFDATAAATITTDHFSPGTRCTDGRPWPDVNQALRPPWLRLKDGWGVAMFLFMIRGSF